MGAKVMLRSIDNDYTVEEQSTAGEWTVLNEFDNRFIYNENTKKIVKKKLQFSSWVLTK